MTVTSNITSVTVPNVTAGVAISFNGDVYLTEDFRVVYGDEQVAVEGVDYIATIAADYKSASIVPTSALVTKANGDPVTVKRDLALTQTFNITNQNSLDERALERAFDRAILILQQLNEVTRRAVTLPSSEEGPFVLPPVEARFGRALMFDAATGRPIPGPRMDAVFDTEGLVTQVEQAAAAADADRIAAEAARDIAVQKAAEVTAIANIDLTPYALLAGADFTTLSVGGQAVWHAGNFNPAAVTPPDNSVTTAKIATKNVTPAKLSDDVLLGHGRCRLIVSGANLALLPRDGNMLVINGKRCTVPSAGVTLASTGLVDNTAYFIYARDATGDGVVDTLEASTTGHSTHTDGVEIQTGAATRTLVGMARKMATGWVDTAAQRFVRSWFNDRGVVTTAAYTANYTTTSATLAELHNEIRNEFLLWLNESAKVDAKVLAANNTAGIASWAGVGLDGVVAANAIDAAYAESANANHIVAMPLSVPLTGLSEGYHVVTLMGRANTGTSSFFGAAAASTPRCTLTVRTAGRI